MGGLFTLPHLGAGIVTFGFIETAILVWRGEAKPWNIVALGFLAVLSGAVVANLTDVKDVLISLSGGNALHLQRTVEEVDTKADQIHAMSDHITDLTIRIQKSDANITQVRDELRQTVQALVAHLIFINNTFPHPSVPQTSFNDLMVELNKLAVFAYPDPKERDAAITHWMADFPGKHS